MRDRPSGSPSCRSGSRSKSRPRLQSTEYEPVPLAEIEAARRRIADTVVRTPLVRLQADGAAEIYLKLENLQPIGSFKLRGAANALALADPGELAAGLWTASAGNMAQAVAWQARERGLPCTVGGPRVFPEMFALARELLDGSLVVGLEAVAAAIRLLVERNRIVAEGAGAVPVAAALSRTGKVVCVVSGGNLDTATLREILQG